MPTAVNEGLYRVGGMYGSAWRDGVQLTEAVDVQVTVEIARIDMPLVGTTKTGYKPGRETREGTLNLQKIDTRWEMEVFSFLTQSLAERRAARGTASAGLRPFQLQLEWDDPDALGFEKWQLEGCLLWRLPLGFAITDDIRALEFPLTYEKETPLAHFERTGSIDPVTGLPAVSQVLP